MEDQNVIEFIKNLTEKLRTESEQEKIFNLLFSETAQFLRADRALLFLLKYSEPLPNNIIISSDLKGKVNLGHEWTKEQGFRQVTPLTMAIADCLFCQKILLEKTKNFLIMTNINQSFSQEEIKKINPFFEIKTYPHLALIPLIHTFQNPGDSLIILGIVLLQYKQVYPWQEEQSILVNWLSLQLSNTIIQNQALRQVQNIVNERTAQLKWSLDVQNKLSEKMRQQIQQLQKVNQLKDDFMTSMSHELNTPLTTMKMAIKMLRQTGELSEKQKRYLDILEQEWHREFLLIKDLLTLQRLESRQYIVNLTEMEVEPILKQAFEVFKHKWQEKNLVLEWNINGIHQPVKIYTDEESFIQIINELLLNAGKYSAPNSLVIFNFEQELKMGQDNIILEISNCGEGIAPEEMPYIFDKFRRGQGTTDQGVPGTGLGLTLVKMLVQQLNGSIEVSSEKAQDSEYFITTFTVILPRFK